MANCFPTPVSSSATDSVPPPSRWWTQTHSLLFRREQLTQQEMSAISKPICYGACTYVIIPLVIVFYNTLRCNVSFSVESFSVSPSSSTCHVDFLVKSQNWRCPINYDGDYVYAKLRPLNAAVLKTSHSHRSRDHVSFSVDFVTSNLSDVVSAFPPTVFELDVKLNAEKKKLVFSDGSIGYFDVRCQNLIIGNEKIKCHSSFKSLKPCC